MEIRINFIAAFVLLIFINTTHAGSLCSQQCQLTIDYPNGGFIKAIAPLTITFGNNGLINTGSSVTAYSEGETLSLNAGESLNFENNGQFLIGNSGNIEYTNIVFDSGHLTLSSTEGEKRINIAAESTITFSSLSSQITINSSILLNGLLVIEGSFNFPISNPVDTTSCAYTTTSGITLYVNSSAVVASPSTTSVCGGVNIDIINTPLISLTSPVIIDNSLTLSITAEPTITFGTFNLDDAKFGENSAKGGSGAIGFVLFALLLIVQLMKLIFQRYRHQ